MSRESKILTARSETVEKLISHYEAFGWELLSINGKQVTMTRETQIPVYTDLVKLQAKYEETKEKYYALKEPQPPLKPAGVNFGLCFILLILFVLPLALYITYKVIQHNKYKEAYTVYSFECSEVQKTAAELLEKMEEIVLQSRGIFFGKQN